MEKRYNLAIRSNFIQLFLAVLYYLSGLYYYYTNITFDIINIILLLLIGLLFFIKINIKYAKLIILTEVLIAPLEYFYFFGRLYLLIIPYIILLLGYKRNENLTYLLIFFVLSTAVLPITTYFGTDEIIIAYYSDHLLLHGLNPYNPQLTKNVFSVYPENTSICGTPYTTGGVVTNLNYPALYILLYLPSYIFSFSPNYIVFFFYLLLPVIVYLRLKEAFPFFISGYMLSYYYLIFSVHGVDDIIWVTFLLLSFLIKNKYLKGVFYGLSVSYKQDPLIFLPFYLIQLKKDSYHFLLASFLTFVLINGYFIFLSPYYFFYDILTPVTANIIQIGSGIDLLSIIGVFYEYPLFYISSQAIILLVGLYFTWKKELKSESTGFVYYIMLFMYRMLYNYISYLPIFTYVEEGGNERRIKRNQKIIIPIAILLILSLALFFHYGFSQYYNTLHIQLLKIYSKDGKVYAMLFNVSFNGEGKIKPFFRIFSSGGLYTGNGLLWESNSTWLEKGESEIVLVYTNYSYLTFTYNSYTIINAYYSYYNAYFTIH
ncbi:hypothetical protein SJAV_20120 [Sulfurisphaera javensis]|uniref:Multipass membrane protein n=1 Tax=Sulfurisphaera javensis TaxID=2049879 RepID=A0AAT9GT63_9CREN